MHLAEATILQLLQQSWDRCGLLLKVSHVPWSGCAVLTRLAKWLNQSRCNLRGRLMWTQGTMYCMEGCTLAPPGKYNWTIYQWWWCSLVSDYFNHLLQMLAKCWAWAYKLSMLPESTAVSIKFQNQKIRTNGKLVILSTDLFGQYLCS